VLFPEATTIVDASVSENGAFFVTEGRRVFAMGDNCFSRFFMEETETRGRPVEVAALRGAVRVALAPYHALAYMGPAIVQPAVNSIANFRAGDGLLQPLGFFIGDVVRFGNGLGFIVGADRRSIDVADAVELRQCEVEEVEFVTRIGFVGIDSGGTLLDGGTALYRQFGIRGGEIVGGASGLASVVGLRKGDVVMRGLTGAEIVFSGSLVGFFEQWTIVHTWRRIEPLAIGGITLPVERVDPFFARYKMRFVKVFAKIAAFWVADGGENGRSLYPQAELVKLQGENGHFEGDRVRIRGKPATVISVAKKSAVILVDGVRTAR
jgi:hypothetical protein